jgi:hypothetical protein
VAEEKSEDDSAGLAWPPTKEDLERLYIEQRLSAAKIAKVYGLEYASQKTAESTILHHLKKNGIKRRDPAEHIRKVSEEIVDAWVSRYEKGESLKQIAGDAVSPVTVFNHLRKRGIDFRERVEAQRKAVTVHEKKPFNGDLRALAYIVGFAKGDLAAMRHGRAIRVKMSTTHPDMTELFRTLFSQHGPIYEYPKKSPLTGFEWSLDCDLDASFEFLLNVDQLAKEFVDREDLFFALLAGFFDADGSVYYHKKKARGAFEFSLTNADGELLRRIQGRMIAIGFSPTLRLDRQSPDRGVKNGGDFIWRLEMWRQGDVDRILGELPMRHAEKRAKAAIALRLGSRPTEADRADIIRDWDLLKKRIAGRRDDYVEGASRSFRERRRD